MAWIERFAPSPTGYLHLGHAFSALTAYESAQQNGGKFILRIEDIDHTRVRPEFTTAIFDDLHWLGLNWPEPVLRQSQNMNAYEKALKKLAGLGLTYACTCNRAAIKNATTNPVFGPDGLVYPGTCRDRNTAQPTTASVRLNMRKAIDYLGGSEHIETLYFDDIGVQNRRFYLDANTLINRCGDLILARSNLGTSYHLSVVIDDAQQNITHITRGMDLFDATNIHRILQELLELPTPTYRHHRLILDDKGKRLAKSDNSRAIRTYRADGEIPITIRQMIGLDRL